MPLLLLNMNKNIIGSNENPFHGRSAWRKKHRNGGGLWYEYSPTISATEYKHVAVIYIEYE